MAKKIQKLIKLQISAGKANPAPPIGPALGQAGINIQEFCARFNNQTKDMGNDILPVEISVYEDKTYTFIMKSPPAAELLKKAAGIQKGAKEPLKEKVGRVTKKQIQEIAQRKMKDLTAKDIEGAVKIIEGTARSMGIEVIS